MFITYLRMAEHQTGKQLKTLRTDGGGEFVSTQFSNFYTDHGILRQVTFPCSSQMNGTAEIKHQILQDQAQTMLLQAKLPTSYWAEAVNTTTYVCVAPC